MIHNRESLLFRSEPRDDLRSIQSRSDDFQGHSALHRLLLLGHSMGADAAVKIAARLAAKNLAVDLLIGFDPTKFACPLIPPNVRRALCFYQKEFGDWLGRGRFHPAPEFAGECVNERVPFRHKKMDDAAELHERVLVEAGKLL